MSTPRIVVVTAGLSSPSSTALLGQRLGASVQRQLQEQNIASEVTEIMLRDHAHAIADYLTMGFPSKELGAALDAVRDADALIVVSPTFKAGFSGLFKSFWDVTTDGDIAQTPTLIAGTGGSPRHALMLESSLRPLFSYLHADVVSTGVFAATDDFADASLQTRIDRAATQLVERILWRGGYASVSSTPAAAQGRGPSQNSSVEQAEGPVPDVEQARMVDSDLNAGQDKHFRAQGLPKLEVTPFEKLLGE